MPNEADIAADLKSCLELRDFLLVELDKNCLSGDPNESRRSRFVRLAALLQNMNAGENGGGLSGALACEKLWVELLKDINLKHPKFSFDPTEADADYTFNDKAFSHKTIGLRNKCADLALAWSKNKAGGVKRKFQSAMAIISFRPANQKAHTKFWRSAKTGLYIIPLDLLRKTVRKFKTNNKTSTLIPGEKVAKLMECAAKHNLFLPIEINPSELIDYELSYWKAGSACVVKRTVAR
jgi:hypothetical protein